MTNDGGHDPQPIMTYISHTLSELPLLTSSALARRVSWFNELYVAYTMTAMRLPKIAYGELGTLAPVFLSCQRSKSTNRGSDPLICCGFASCSVLAHEREIPPASFTPGTPPQQRAHIPIFGTLFSSPNVDTYTPWHHDHVCIR
jgi:hypothetical protein